MRVPLSFSSFSRFSSRHSSRGQASFEFLSTYGFALLLLLMTLGALSYFGFFNTASLRSVSCSFPQGLACNDFILDQANPGTGSAPYLRMNVTNSYGVNITITSMQLTSRQFTNVMTCSPIPPPNWGDGTTAVFWCPIPVAAYAQSEYYEGAIAVNFTQVGGGFEHSIVGRFSARAQ